MKTAILKWCWAMVLGAVLLLIISNPSWSAENPVEKRVLILQPKLNGNPDMAYLSQGVVDMLTTRLSKPGRIAIIEAAGIVDPAQAIDRDTALEIARQSDASHVVFGTLTLLGASISTDLRMADVAQEAILVSFSRSGKDSSALIEHVNEFAAEANVAAFGLDRAAPKTAAVPAVAPNSTQAGQPGSIYQHPEKLLQQPMNQSGAGRYGDDGIGAVMIGAGDALRGPRLDGQVQSLALGDVDGDGITEAVIAGTSTIWVYKFANGRFSRMATVEGRGNYIGVDTADLNQDGKDEIFVTNFDNNDGRVMSFVLEHDGGKFERRAQLLKYYFRTINVPMRGRVLFGQRQGLETLFQPGIYEMEWENNEYRAGTRIKTPRGQNIFGMGFGTMPASPEQMVFAYNSSTEVKISDSVGNEEWTSSEGYGLAATLVQVDSKEDLSSKDFRYLPGRIEVLDLDGDGASEVVVLSNDDLSSNLMKRTRLFKHGRIEVLKADELGMAVVLRTRYLPKYISGFAIGDLDQDGQPDILTAVVQKPKGIVSDGRSNLYLFRLGSLLADQRSNN